jgi:hypothetical protein
MSGERVRVREREKKEEGTSIKLILYGFMEGILLVVIFVVCARCCETHRTEKQPKFILNFLSKHFSPISHQSASKLPSLPQKGTKLKSISLCKLNKVSPRLINHVITPWSVLYCLLTAARVVAWKEGCTNANGEKMSDIFS